MKPSLAIRRLLLASALLATTITVHAQLYWDTDGTTAGFGAASGTWGTDSFWNDDASGGAGTFSTTTSTSDSLNFGTASDGLATGTISVSGTVDSGDMTFGSASGAITLSGGTINFANTATITTNNATNTIGSVITGADTSLTIDGTGTLVLTGTNIYTGDTIVNAGTLAMASNVIQDSSNIFIAGEATISHTTAGNFTLGGSQNLFGTGTGTATFTNTDTAANRSIIALGNNEIGHTGTGTLILRRYDVRGTGVTMTGGNVEAGVTNTRGLAIGNITHGEFTITSGTLTTKGTGNGIDIIGIGSATGTLNINGGSYVSNGLAIGAGNTASFPGGTLNINSGSATIGSFVYNFSNAPGSEGMINLNGGTLTLGGITSTAGASRIFNFNGGQFIASGNVSIPAIFTTNVLGAGANINTGTNTVTIAANMLHDGTGGLTKSGAGTLILSGTNTYVGATSVNAGVLQINSTGALDGTSAINLGTTTGGTIQFLVSGTTISVPITLANTGVTSTISSSSVTGGTQTFNLNGIIGGDGNLLFSTHNDGSGNPGNTFVLNAANTYAGTTTLNAGHNNNNALIVSGIENALPTTTILVFGNMPGGGTGRTHNFNLNGNNQTLAGLSSSAVSLRIQRVHNTSGTPAVLTLNDNGNRTFNGALGTTGGSNTSAGNNFSIVKNGTGTWTLQLSSLPALVNSYNGGTILNQGGITLNTGATLGTGSVQVNNTNTGAGTDVVLTTTADDLTIGSLSGTIATASSGTNTATIDTAGRTLTVNQTANGTYEGTITGTDGSLVLGEASSQTLTLLGNNTYTGTTSIQNGALALGVDASIASSSSLTLGAAGTLNTTAQANYAIPASQPVTFTIDPTGSGSSGTIVANGLDITDASVTLSPTDTLDGPVYVIASYSGTLTGTAFASVSGLPAGYTIDYAYQGDKIALIGGAPSGFASWQSVNGTTGGFADDHDGDGVPNGIEYFLGGPNGNTTGFTALPGVENDNGTRSITWTMGAGYGGEYGIDFWVETSDSLEAESWNEEDLNDTVTITGNDVKFTFTAPLGTKNFARLKVTGP